MIRSVCGSPEQPPLVLMHPHGTWHRATPTLSYHSAACRQFSWKRPKQSHAVRQRSGPGPTSILLSLAGGSVSGMLPLPDVWATLIRDAPSAESSCTHMRDHILQTLIEPREHVREFGTSDKPTGCGRVQPSRDRFQVVVVLQVCFEVIRQACHTPLFLQKPLALLLKRRRLSFYSPERHGKGAQKAECRGGVRQKGVKVRF